MPQVSLRPIRISDAEICFRWISDPQVQRFLGVLQPARTLAQERSWIANILTDKQQRAFIIEDEEGRPIGTCGLRGIDSERGTSFLGIMIGDKGLWDKGYGTAATTKLVEYAFGELGLREIRLSCHRENRRALRCYEKAGFRPSRRTPGRRGARPEDVHMSVGREAWLAGRRLDHDAEAAEEAAGQAEARAHLREEGDCSSEEIDG